MALEYLTDSDGFENTTPTAARNVSIVESKDVNEGALFKYIKNTNTENLLVAPSAIASTIHDQLNDRSDTSTNCNAKLKEISNKNALICKHTDIHNRQKRNNKLVNNSDIQDVQRIPVRITQRSYKKNKPKRKSNSNIHPIRRHRLGFPRIYDKTSKPWANHLDLVRTVTYGTLVSHHTIYLVERDCLAIILITVFLSFYYQPHKLLYPPCSCQTLDPS